MADLIADAAARRNGHDVPTSTARPAPASAAGREHLIACAELLFFAYRDFIVEPDNILAKFGFGRAHHRVLHFVYRHPGLRVADLLDILKITKQSLARVLRQLVGEGFILQRAGNADRRERHLFAADEGARLAETLIGQQADRIRQALAAAGAATGTCAEDVTRHFLFAMIAEADRARVASLISDLPPSSRAPAGIGKTGGGA